MSEVTTELQWIDKWFSINDKDQREYKLALPSAEKGLGIIKEIPKRNYKKLMYKINNYFKNE